MSINSVSITGNLTRDAELRTTPSGVYILSFGVAVNDRRKNKDGEWEDYPNFVDCNLIGTRAEKLAPYLTKGKKVAVNGKLHYSSWEDKNGGGRRSKLDVTVSDLEFMSSSENRSEKPAQSAAYAPQSRPAQQPAPAAYDDEDIPF